MTNLMTRYVTSTQKNWIRWTSWLLMVASLVIAPVTSYAAPAQPQISPTSYLPMLQNNYCTGQRSTEIPIGTQLYGLTGYTQPHFQLLQDTASAWLRNSIYWASVEPTNVATNQYNWNTVENTLIATKHNCLNMIVTIEGTPSWAVEPGNIDGRSPIKSANIADFVQFVTALVERYDGDGNSDSPNGIVVNYWEFYNEPDFGSQVGGRAGWGNYPERYTQLLQAVYPAVKAANPNAKVLLGGIAYNSFVKEDGTGLFVRNFLKNILDAGAGNYFDIMNFHYYPFQHNREEWTTTDASGLAEKYASIKTELDAHGVGSKPFMITEVGWHSSTTNARYPSTPEIQSRRVVELITQGMSIGSQVTIWWTFFDERQDFAYRTGLTTADDDPTAKPSYAVYQEVMRRLGNSEFAEVTIAPTVQKDLEAYRFRAKSNNKTFYVAWMNPVGPVDVDAVPTFDDSVTQALRVPGAKATVFSKEGLQTQIVNDGDDGAIDNTVTVTVGRSPIYIVIN